jgi:hypothetical protein
VVHRAPALRALGVLFQVPARGYLRPAQGGSDTQMLRGDSQSQPLQVGQSIDKIKSALYSEKLIKQLNRPIAS